VAGILGTLKLCYDTWGDTVNTASRMDSTCPPGRIQVTKETFDRVCTKYEFETRSEVYAKGKGLMTTYLLHTRYHDNPTTIQNVSLLSSSSSHHSSFDELADDPPLMKVVNEAMKNKHHLSGKRLKHDLPPVHNNSSLRYSADHHFNRSETGHNKHPAALANYKK